MAGGAKSASARETLAAALATGATVADACKTSGVSSTTAYRWLKDDPTFKARVSELRTQAISEAVGVLGANARKASQTLADLLDATAPGIKLAAARSLLEFALKATELLQVAQRVEDLERLLGGEKDGKKGGAE